MANYLISKTNWRNRTKWINNLHKFRNILEIFSYTEEQNKVNDLSYFSFYSAFFNGLNSLFISGGDTIISSFWDIDFIENMKMKKIMMIFQRKTMSSTP